VNSDDVAKLRAPEIGSGLVSRRDLLRMSAVGLAGLALAPALAGCTSSRSGAQSASATASLTPVKGGTLRVSVTGGGLSDNLDAHGLVTVPDYARDFQLYDSLIAPDDQGKLTLQLAESIEPNADGTEWTIRVKPGIVTHAGKPFGAKDVLFTLNRIVKGNYPGATTFGAIDLPASRVVDAQTLVLKYKKPFAILPEALSTAYALMVPEGYDPKAPVGTGPFKFKSFTPGTESTFVRFDEHWRGAPYLDAVVITDVADDTGQVNGIQSGQFDAVTALSLASVAPLTAAGFTLLAAKTGGWGPFTMSTAAKPFTDVRVRQAMRLLLDREQMVAQLFGEYGTVGNDVFGRNDPHYPSDLPQRKQDIEQAKSLLKAAGQEGLAVELVSSPLAVGLTDAAQVLTTQAKAAGVTINVVQQNPTDFFAKSYLKVPFAQSYWPAWPYLYSAAAGTVPGAPFPETHFNDPDYGRLYDQAIATLDETKRGELIGQMARIDYDRGGYVIPFFFPNLDATSSKLHGVAASVTGQALGNWDFTKAWLAT